MEKERDEDDRSGKKVILFNQNNNFIQTFLRPNVLMKNIVKDVHDVSKILITDDTIIIKAGYTTFYSKKFLLLAILYFHQYTFYVSIL